jgi:hypothetical protein
MRILTFPTQTGRVRLPGEDRTSVKMATHVAALRERFERAIHDPELELPLVEPASEPCSTPACCATHAAGRQTPDGRWWCWNGVATVTLPDPDPSPALKCRRTANLWAEYMHQDLETGRWRSLEVASTRVRRERICEVWEGKTDGTTN